MWFGNERCYWFEPIMFSGRSLHIGIQSSIATLASAAAILEEPRGPRAGRLAFGQLDLSPRALRFRLLGNRHFQNALLELCLGVVGVDPLRQRDGAVEVTIAALRVIVVALFLFLLDLLLAFDREHVVVHRDLHILLIEAGQLGI